MVRSASEIAEVWEPRMSSSGGSTASHYPYRRQNRAACWARPTPAAGRCASSGRRATPPRSRRWRAGCGRHHDRPHPAVAGLGRNRPGRFSLRHRRAGAAGAPGVAGRPHERCPVHLPQPPRNGAQSAGLRRSGLLAVSEAPVPGPLCALAERTAGAGTGAPGAATRA